MFKFYLPAFIIILCLGFKSLPAQVCADAASHDQDEFGNGFFIGYVYQFPTNSTTPSENLFPPSAGVEYLGRYTLAIGNTFDINFGGGTGTFNTDVNCSVNRDWFSVRFRMEIELEGVYNFIIGSDDGSRLIIENSSGEQLNANSEFVSSGLPVYFINRWANSAYGTQNRTTAICLPQDDYKITLEYYERTGGNRVSFNYAQLTDGDPGQISGNQSFCSNSPVNPATLSNSIPAVDCNASADYQWQFRDSPSDAWNDISGATDEDYTPPPGLTNTRFYRRAAFGGVEFSNVVTVTIAAPVGDEATVGVDEWRAYFYDTNDRNNPFVSGNYIGERIFPEFFNTFFCVSGSGGTCNILLDGCTKVADNFTVRAFMNKTFDAGTYTFRTRSDDGVRLFLDDNNIINAWVNRGFPGSFDTATPVFLDGSSVSELRLEYYEANGDQQLQFDWLFENTLPVELISIRLTCDGLRWTTASETNNDYFTIYESFDGIDFTPIFFINGAGDSRETLTYFHPFTPKNNAIYRLSQTDFDGTFEWLHTASVRCESQTKMSLKHRTLNLENIDHKGEFLQIFDLSGREVYKKTVFGDEKIALPQSIKGLNVFRLNNIAEKYFVNP
jgi:hypothetical protein